MYMYMACVVEQIFSAIIMQSNLLWFYMRHCGNSELDFRITTYTLYLALTGELWGVYCEDFRENWQRYYNGTVLY